MSLHFRRSKTAIRPQQKEDEMSKSETRGVGLKSKAVRAAVLNDKAVLFSDALDKTRYLSPLEADTGQEQVRCAVFFSRSKKNKRSGNNSPSVKEYAGTVVVPATLFGNAEYGFVLHDEERMMQEQIAADAKAEKLAAMKERRDFS
jgi:uncharacterized protein YutD